MGRSGGFSHCDLISYSALIMKPLNNVLFLRDVTNVKHLYFPVWPEMEVKQSMDEELWLTVRERLQKEVTELQTTLGRLHHEVNHFKEQLAEKDQRLISSLHKSPWGTIAHVQTMNELTVTEAAVEASKKYEALKLNLQKKAELTDVGHQRGLEIKEEHFSGELEPQKQELSEVEEMRDLSKQWSVSSLLKHR